MKIIILFGFVVNVVFPQIFENDCEFPPNNKTVFALILARGGSKGIYRKNLRTINGISLIANNLIKLKKSELFKEIWVSTEDTEIALQSKKYGAHVHKRSKYLSQDETSSLDSIKEFLKFNKNVQNFVLFQCTSIFLQEWQIEEGLKLFENCECVFSVTRTFKLRWKLNNQQYATPLNFNPKNRPRRQNWNGELIENGMFYFTNRQLIENEHTLQSNRCKVVVIPEEYSMEIDKEMDLRIAEFLLQSKN